MPSARAERRPAAILFDLDGTVADTAPDLGAALNRLRAELGLAPVPLEGLRPHTSSGVRGMLHAGLGMATDHPDYRDRERRFLDHYQAGICERSALFPGIDQLIDRIERDGIPWGIVTNKRQRFTLPLLRQLDIDRRAACIVSGDSAARAKPHANPMLLACALIGCAPESTCYVGDDRRDIVAGQAAGMRTIAVRYGYLGDGPAIEQWGADHIVDAVEEIAVVAGLVS